MDPQPQQEDTVLALNTAIEAIDLAQKVSSITPAKTAFGSVRATLLIIKVCCSPPFRSILADRWLIYTGLLDRRSGLRQPRSSLRRRMQSSRPRVEGKAGGWAQSAYPRGHSIVDDVGVYAWRKACSLTILFRLSQDDDRDREKDRQTG